MTQHLLKNSESGVYYARIKQRGKQVWQSLKTEALEKGYLEGRYGGIPVLKIEGYQ